jgi:hypothetical protein
MAALLYGLLQMLNISGRGFDTRLRDRLGSLSLGAEKISINSSDFWSTLQYGRFEDVTALFTGILYEVNVPFIVAVDNVERLEEQSDNIVTMLYNLCSSKRVKISAAVSGSISRVAGRNDLYKAREDTEYQGKVPGHIPCGTLHSTLCITSNAPFNRSQRYLNCTCLICMQNVCRPFTLKDNIRDGRKLPRPKKEQLIGYGYILPMLSGIT